MTAQFADEVEYRERSYAVTAVEGISAFAPTDHGITPRAWSSACWRGFQCRYALPDGDLHLVRLIVGVNDEPLPRIDGMVPTCGTGWALGTWIYDGLGLPVRFTGRLLVGAGLVRGRPFPNMGFLPAWFYEDVKELVLDGGRLVDIHDRSVDLAHVRERMMRSHAGRREGDALKRWIEATFSLSFAYSWPGSDRPHGQSTT